MNLKKTLIITGFVSILIIGIIGWAWPTDRVRVVPLYGPIGTVQISPPNGSTIAYRMDMGGQKSICFQNTTAVDVYLSSSTNLSTSNGWGLFTKGSGICLDLQEGTSIYFLGDGAGADVRAILAK